MNKLSKVFFSLVLSVIFISYQNCDSFKVSNPNQLINSANSNDFNQRYALNNLNSVSQAVNNKFGYIDAPAHSGLNGITRARFEKFHNDVQPGIRIYNYWLSSVEQNFVGDSAQYVASTQPMSCPGGTQLYPEAGQKGRFHFYRCIDRNSINRFKDLFSYDKSKGVRPIVSIYGTPEQYRPSECNVSSDFARLQNTNVHKWGCPPTDIRQYEDLVRIYVREVKDHVKDFSLWNENNSNGWFYVREGENRIQKYFELMKITDRIIREEGISDYRLFVSLDMNWTVSPESGMSARDFLNQLWSQSGVLEIPWSLNLHPYTDEQAVDPNGFPEDHRSRVGGFYGFGNLNEVLDFQKNQILRAGGAENSIHSLALLGEQGWYLKPQNTRSVAIEICKAQDIMNKNPKIIGAAYNSLIDTPAQDDIEGQAGLALLPKAFFPGFNDAVNTNYESVETYQAMKSTHPNNWGRNRNHFCCQNVGLGCTDADQPTAVKPIIGSLDSVELYQTSGLTINGWACQKTNRQSIEVKIYVNNESGSGNHLLSATADLQREDAVKSACESDHSKYGYVIQVPENQLSNIYGKRVYAFGVDPSNANSKTLLGHSGLVAPTAPASETLTYNWSTGDFGSCSVSPSYSYGNWSSCQNRQQTRTHTCVNMSGTQSRDVWCKNSQGARVADSNCRGTKPALIQTCQNNCVGAPLVSQSCQVIPTCSNGATNAPTCTMCPTGQVLSNRVCSVRTFNLSGNFGSNASGAQIQGCGVSAVASSTGAFSFSQLNAGTVCNNISISKPGYTCTMSSQGPAALNSNVSSVRGTCSLIPQPFIGALDEVKRESHGLKVRGWTCQKKNARSVGVQVYINGPIGEGSLLTSGQANVVRENAVQIECESSQRNHGYEVNIQGSLLSRIYGKRVFVYAIDPLNSSRKTLLGNGGLLAPLAPSAGDGATNPPPEPTCSSLAIAGVCLDLKKVKASVGGVTGQTGHWWCENHFGNNLGGYWQCHGGNCNSVAAINNEFTCVKRNELYYKVRATTARAGQTGKWWCDNHFGKNLGGVWTCLGTNCQRNINLNEEVKCIK